MNTSPITPTCKQFESAAETLTQSYAQAQQTVATMAMQQAAYASQIMQVTSAYIPMLAKSQSLPDATYTMATLFGAYTHIMQQTFINQTRACGHFMQQAQTMAQRHAAMPWLQASQPAQTTTKPATQTLSQRIAQRLAERAPASAPITSVAIITKKTVVAKKSKAKATPAALLVSALAAKAQLKWAQTQMETLTAKPAAPLAKAQQQWAAAIQQPATVSAKVEVTTVADTADLMSSFPVPPTLPSAEPMVSATSNSVMRVTSHVAQARSAHARGVRQSVMARRSARIVKVAR